MKFRNFLLFGTITLFTTSCSNNSTDDLTGSFPLVEVAKYNENVKDHSIGNPFELFVVRPAPELFSSQSLQNQLQSH